MRRILIAVSALTLWTGAALAAGDVMAGYYGNTVVSTGGGIESRTHYRADKSFDATFSAGGQSLTSKGTWSIDGAGQLCRVYDTPPPGITNPICIANAAHKAGDSWTVTVNGASRDVKLVAGVQ